MVITPSSCRKPFMSRRIQVRNSPIHGRGVFAAVDLAAESRVIEYQGLRLSHAKADARYAGNSETGHTFLFTLNDAYVIDANQGGNDARWINHSCAPNCEAEDDSGQVYLMALRNIKPGEELGYDYGDFAAHNGLWESAEKTAHDVLVRMACVPRVLEARGLDVTPNLIRRLREVGDQDTVAVLEVILAEEVGHVEIGTRWFHHCCAERNLDPVPTFRRLLAEQARQPLRAAVARHEAALDLAKGEAGRVGGKATQSLQQKPGVDAVAVTKAHVMMHWLRLPSRARLLSPSYPSARPVVFRV